MLLVASHAYSLAVNIFLSKTGSEYGVISMSIVFV